MNYPDVIDNIPNIVDLVTPVEAAAINPIIQGVLAVEQTLGINIQGVRPTLNSRISSVITPNGALCASSGTLDGVIIGSVTPCTGLVNNLTITGTFVGDFCTSTTYGVFSTLNARLEAYELDGRGSITDSVVPANSASSLLNRLNMFANRIKTITGETDWKTTPAISLSSTVARFGIIEADDWVVSARINIADATPPTDPNTGSGIATDHLRDKAVTEPKLGDSAVSTRTVGDFQITPGKLSTDVAVCPPGTIIPYFHKTAIGQSFTPPAGWLECDGAAYSTTTYSALFNIIGYQAGNPGGGQFNVPDLRGAFIRGWSHGSYTLDSQYAARTALNPTAKDSNGATLASDNIGSYQADTVGPHIHTYYYSYVGAGGAIENGPYQGNNAASGSTDPMTTIETRPKNVYVAFLIKF